MLCSKTQTKSLVNRLLVEFASPYYWIIIFAFICMTISAITTALLAKQMEPIINDIFIRQDEKAIFWIILGVLIIFAFKGTSSYGQAIAMSYVGQKLISDGKRKIYSSLIQADLAYVNKTAIGQLVARATNDVEAIGTIITNTITRLVKDSLTLFALLIVMFQQDYLLSSITFIVFPIAIIPVLNIGKKLRKFSKNARQSIAHFTSLLTQTLQGIKMIKTYSLQDIEKKRAFKNIENIFKYYFQGARISALNHPIMEFLGGVAIVIVVAYGGHQVIQGSKTAGAFFSFITALIMAYEPLKGLAKLNTKLQESLASIIRSFEIIDLKPIIQNKLGAIDLKIKKGEISIENVSFSYIKNNPILKNISLKIKTGKKIALIGPSGGGKSTIINLILRLYDIPSGKGRIKINGHDIRNLTLDSLRNSISIVSQEIVIFDDTIFANISFGSYGATMGKVKKAAKASTAHEFIKNLPKGYNTIVGEQGVTLSGGQRQKISIARAMLRDAPILILDEATCALDSVSETHIQNTLKPIMKKKITLIIAHRLATVIDSDCLYLIKKGKIESFGTHKELLKNSTLYASLYSSQFESLRKNNNNKIYNQ